MLIFKKSSLGRPSSIEPHLDAHPVSTKTFDQFRKTRGNSTDGKNTIGSAVASLGTRCAPSHIVGFVVPVIINSVNRFAIWWFANIAREIRKRFSPPGTHLNAASTISLERFRMTVATALNHAAPYSIEAGTFVAAAMAVGKMVRFLSFQTTTRTSEPMSEHSVLFLYRPTAGANTYAASN